MLYYDIQFKLTVNLNNCDIEATYGGNDSKDIKNEFEQIEGRIDKLINVGHIK